MYIPAHFAVSDPAALHRIIREHPLGMLVRQGDNGLDADHIPFELDPATGPLGTLTAHVARANPLWQQCPSGSPVMVVFRGAEAFISPNWYPSKHESHRQVPTWNYEVVHAQGTITVHDDERFVRGLVDSADLPLNVSRELLQGSRTTEKIKGALTKRVLDLLDDLAANHAEKYTEFWKTFGAVLKEGVIDDHANKDRVAKLLRFASTQAPEGQTVSLADYIGRMQPEQKGIYFVTADTLAAAKNSPHLEGFVAKGFEVLLLTDRIDEWLTSNLREFEGKKLESVARAAKDIESAIETPEKAQAESDYKDTLERLKKALAGRISEAKVSARLTESPACLVAGEYGMSLRMERMMKAAGQASPFGGAPVFEINPGHPLVQRLKETADDTAFADLAGLLHDQAVLAEGGALEDPASFVKRLNKLILDGLGEKSRILLT